MANQSSKRGVRSDSQKRDRSRYDFDPIPATARVEGAFGITGEAFEPERAADGRESERSDD